MAKLCVTVVFVSFAVFSGVSHAQEDARNYLGLSFGGSDFHILDKHASPLIFRGIGIAPAFDYFHVGENNFHAVDALYYYSYLGSSADNLHTGNHRARLRYTYLHGIADFEIFDERLTLLLGGSVNSYLSYSTYYFQYFSSGDARAIASWLWSNSVDLSLRLQHRVSSRELLSAWVEIPVVSSVSRPAYSPSGYYNYDENEWRFGPYGLTEIFPRNFSIDGHIAYQRPLSPNFNLELSYEWYYSAYGIPKPINMYTNDLRAGLFYCF